MMSMCWTVTSASQGGWLCDRVLEMLNRHSGSNVIGFTDGDLKTDKLTAIQDLDYPEGCSQKVWLAMHAIGRSKNHQHRSAWNTSENGSRVHVRLHRRNVVRVSLSLWTLPKNICGKLIILSLQSSACPIHFLFQSASSTRLLLLRTANSTDAVTEVFL